MPVNVFLSSILRRYVPEYEPSKGLLLSVAPKTTVSELCRRMKIPEDMIKVIMVNGRNASMDVELSGDERIGLFPPVGGG